MRTCPPTDCRAANFCTSSRTPEISKVFAGRANYRQHRNRGTRESKGTTVELSETGVSSYLREEFESGQQVKVQLALSAGPVIMPAVVRHKTGTRYGFQFLDLPPEHAQKI